MFQRVPERAYGVRGVFSCVSLGKPPNSLPQFPLAKNEGDWSVCFLSFFLDLSSYERSGYSSYDSGQRNSGDRLFGMIGMGRRKNVDLRHPSQMLHVQKRFIFPHTLYLLGSSSPSRTPPSTQLLSLETGEHPCLFLSPSLPTANQSPSSVTSISLPSFLFY